MLLTNAIFLHIRECYPLDSIRLTFWCLCFTGDLDYVLLELIIPSLRPCVGCADSIVRRASASLLHSVIEAVRCAQISSTVNCTDTPTSGPQPNGFDSLFQLISQVARDDLTGQRKLINSDEADWSVLALATGPLYSFLTFCRKGLSSCSASNGTASVDAPSPAIRFPVSDGLTSTERVSVDFEEQLYELIRLQFNLVIGVSDSSSLTEPDTSGTTVGILATQQRFWPVLTLALLSLTDHLLPSCPNSFRDEVVLPWLYKLTEMSNSLSNVEQRAQLADRLFAVLSTAAYSVQLEESLFLWLVPGLDRVRLDLIEAGDTMRTHEVELFLNDLYSRIRADESGIISDKPKESGGLRNAVSNQLARLKSRSLNPSGHMHRHGASRHSDLGQVKVGSSRLGLRKR
ncbi:hypothetical protein EG68_06851 [Paragonimus skrjabini miyazakii]|uniref:Uncharacterized protein n=1 Tax=Paragonimus skrjabini miyazakii TaxID=59628 RepID=A0A8S9YLF8_9TREM|nr:hypothetical protein EG68_06851 [Paragonimus skrjabini miyazakii]